jgi:hypothetical protein
MKIELIMPRPQTNSLVTDHGYKTFVLRAQHCREEAETANSPVEKETWLAVAEEYLHLAQAVGKQNEDG